MFLVLQGIWCSKALPSTPVLSELFLINKHDKVLSRKKKRHVTMSNIHKRNMPKLTAVAKVCVREVAGSWYTLSSIHLWGLLCHIKYV